MPIGAFPPDVQEQWRLTTTRFMEWLQGDVLNLQWQIMLALFLLAVWLWWKKVDKTRLAEMVFYSALIIVFVIALDELGDELSLWYYTVDIFPLFPPMTAIDLSCLPLVYMLIYQHTRYWKTFILVTVGMSVVFCFVFEPIFVWSGIYQLMAWRYYYGLPLYFLIGVASRFIAMRIFHPSAKKKSA